MCKYASFRSSDNIKLPCVRACATDCKDSILKLWTEIVFFKLLRSRMGLKLPVFSNLRKVGNGTLVFALALVLVLSRPSVLKYYPHLLLVTW